MFLLGRKLYGSLIGFLGAFAVASNVNVLDYATTGASETLFMFEIVLAAYLLSFRKKWMDIFGALTLIVMYFTRPHAFIFIAGLILYWLLLRFKVRKALVYFIGLIFLGLVLDRLVLMPLSGQFFIYSITGRGSHAVTQHLPGVAVSESLRGVSQNVGLLTVFKKVFYNLYNFYKLLPQIASPYMWALFVIGLFKWGKDRVKNSLKLVTLLLVIGTFLVTALTIPFFRYIHPVIPLVYFFATATLVWIVELMVKGQWLRIKRHLPRFISKKAQLVGIISVLLILFFVVGQALGVIFLDSRFKAARTNKDRPPVYVSLSWILKDNTEPDSVIITNLDTWGSWYGERKTVWFPLNPDQLKLEGEDKLVFDAIFLTSYLMDDENYYMGDEWRQVFYNPEKPENEFIAENYELKEVYQISTEETYEKQVARAVLLTRKKINGL